jgi:hypothetical protein
VEHTANQLLAEDGAVPIMPVLSMSDRSFAVNLSSEIVDQGGFVEKARKVTPSRSQSQSTPSNLAMLALLLEFYLQEGNLDVYTGLFIHEKSMTHTYLSL